MKERVNSMMKKDIRLFVCGDCGTLAYEGTDYEKCLDKAAINKESSDSLNEKEKIYHELVSQYWAWKNVNADYYGFNSELQRFDYSSDYSSLDEAVEHSDIILTEGIEYGSWQRIMEKKRFKGLIKKYVFDVEDVYTTILDLYPNYAEAVGSLKNGGIVYVDNNFIMKKDIFFEYCALLFTVLFEVEKKTDFSLLNEQELFSFSYMSELILSVYLLKLKSERTDIRILSLPLKRINQAENVVLLQPVYSENAVTITFSCNEKYMPILGVMLKSLLDCAGKEYNYDLIVMQRNPDNKSSYIETQRVLLEDMVKSYTNANIRFMDVSSLIDSESFYVHYNYTPETYFRLFLPQILRGYKKILYMDADVIVKHDIAELYNIDLEGAILGAVRDPIIIGTSKSARWSMQEYMLELGVSNIYDYFQAGILLIDIEEISKNDLPKRMIEYAMTHECELVDQDVLNLFCQGRVRFIDNRWNVDVNPVAMEVVPAAPADIWKLYQRNRREAYVYHFAGDVKPWWNPDMEKAEIFWEVARKTPWYEQLLGNMTKHMLSEREKRTESVWHFPFKSVRAGSSIAIYGAGNVGKAFKKTMELSGYANILLWVDKDFENLLELGVKSPESLRDKKEIDNIIIAINNKDIAQEISKSLEDMGVDAKKVVWEEYSK